MFRYAVTDNVITEETISQSVCSESEHNSNSKLCSLHNILVQKV
jgi:hypothetical protein